MAKKEFLDAYGLSYFLNKLKDLFANINHTHTISNITDISECVNESVATSSKYTDNQIANQSSETWTFTLIDGSTITKEIILK